MRKKYFICFMILLLVILLNTIDAFAIQFTPVLDEFWIVKDTVEIFRDSFNDGILPPDGPDGSRTYSMYGADGITSEANGKLTMTPLLGDPVIVTSTFADLSTSGLRNLATNSANTNYLGIGSEFEIHGLFDMSNLPLSTGQSFGIRANDRAPALGNEGNNTFNLFVGVSAITSEVGVFLRINDFTNNTSEVLWSSSIAAQLATADQVELILSKEANSDLLIASYFLYDTQGNIFNSVSKNDNTWDIYDGEDYIRAEFISTDRVPVPEPSTFVLLGAGLAGLVAWSKKKRA